MVDAEAPGEDRARQARERRAASLKRSTRPSSSKRSWTRWNRGSARKRRRRCDAIRVFIDGVMTLACDSAVDGVSEEDAADAREAVAAAEAAAEAEAEAKKRRRARRRRGRRVRIRLPMREPLVRTRDMQKVRRGERRGDEEGGRGKSPSRRARASEERRRGGGRPRKTDEEEEGEERMTKADKENGGQE